MRHAILRGAAGAMGVAALLATPFPAPAAAAEPTIIKFGSITPASSGQVVDIFEPWFAKIEKEAGGTLKFEKFYGGSLVRSYPKQYEALINGIQDGATVLPSYTQALFPEFGLFSLPFMFRGPGAKEAAHVGWNLHEKGMLGGLEKVHVLAVFTNDNSGMHFVEEIKSLDEIDGLKVRAAGPGEAAVIEAAGATPVAMGISQVAGSLNRHVIDGTLNGWSALETFRITPLIETHVDLPFGVRSFFIALNKEVFDALPEKARKAIDANSGYEFSMTFGRYWGKQGAELRKTLAKEHTVLTPTDSEMPKWEAKFRHIQEAWIAEDKPRRQKLFDTAKRLLADFRGGGS